MTRTTVKTCEYCGQEFDSAAKYAAHKRREHPGWREGLVPLLAEANGAEAAEQPTESMPLIYTCSQCEDSFRTGRALESHQRWCRYRQDDEVEEQAEEQGQEVEAEEGVIEQPEEVIKFSMRYCPSCGTALDKVQQVLHHMQLPISYCPGCGLDLLIIQQGME